MSHPQDRFSKRMNVRGVPPEISTYEAPDKVRIAVVELALEFGLGSDEVVDVACRVLLERPAGNWSDGYLKDEAHGMLARCEWFKVYDIAEVVADELNAKKPPSPPEWIFDDDGFSRGAPQPLSEVDVFSKEFTDVLIDNGVGWKMAKGRIELRGGEASEAALRSALSRLDATGRVVAAAQLREALHDISRRPEPDITGSVQHAMAALECLIRDITGDSQPTLGALLKRNPGFVPKPLDIATEKIWGYASENARHVTEGHPIAREEAALVVWLSAALADYLVLKYPPQS